MEIIKLLNILVKNGYVLHGSRHSFRVAIPNKKEKIHPRAGTLNAVYATDKPLLAIFKAVLNAKKTPQKKGLNAWKFNKNGDIFFKITPNYLKYNGFCNGYIYIFEKKKFKKDSKNPYEFYSINKVTPICKIKVRWKDFIKQQNFEFWNIEEIEKTGFYTREESISMWK